ncbi:MAG: endopeptidase La [Alphaproteobacteria bacterium]|nr:endopeptidase La [Alphaproteobacteria bacterium]MCB9698304.1 endopeptidase La [Alphaproteobacteria bacterium]
MSFENPTDPASANLPSVLEIPVLAIRNTVIFPVLAFPINVGRSKSIKAVEEALATEEKYLGIFAQRDPKTEDPEPSDLYQVGTVVKILKMVKVPGNKLNVIIQGLSRARIRQWKDDGGHLVAEIEPYKPEPASRDAEELMDTLRELAQKIIDLSPQIPAEASFLVRSIDEPGVLADIVASNLSIPPDEKQDLLETFPTHERMQKVIALLNKEIQVLELSNKIQTEVKGEMDKAQREYFLREQLKAIQKELGEVDERQEEFEELKRSIKRARMPKDVEEAAFKELKRMSRMSPGAAEYTVSRTYIDWLCELPWSITSKDRLDVNEAERILDEDHYGLEKVKQRILEFLAVRKLKQDMKGPILCLVGPPGVGKTSLAKSVARALGRKMVRIALGGVRDEAEIRGHRRTYIGSMPGKIIKGMKKAGSNNPVFVLDEIDKLGADYRGDPSSALLEVLDPEQNDSFTDHYLDVSFDLSKVLFVATANVPDTIPGPLRDRMEIIRIAGYTHQEKTQIARRYLWKECLDDHGLTDDMVTLPDATLDKVIESYTQEAGVRGLKRELAAVCRWCAREIAAGKREPGFEVSPELLEEMRGPIHYWKEVAERTAVPGVATGLAWTATGGEILFIEATKMKGKGGMTLTGSLGDVMKESVSVARSYIRSMADELGIDDKDFESLDLHVHVPSGAIPKDGPSAGVTMITAITSLLTGAKVDPTVAMTGEITLRGAVLPIGGVKEKVLAAHRAGIKTVLLPDKNRKDLVEVPDEIKNELSFHFVSRLEEVLDVALGSDAIASARSRLALKRQQEAAAKEATPAPSPQA